jgi:tRNA(fMet)-specific endonuclease VapC
MKVMVTDHVSLLDRGGATGAAIRWRMERSPHGEVAVTIVSFEEQVRGWNAPSHRRAR